MKKKTVISLSVCLLMLLSTFCASFITTTTADAVDPLTVDGYVIDAHYVNSTIYAQTIVQVSDTVYAIAYQGSSGTSGRVYVRTVGIAQDGSITNSKINEFPVVQWIGSANWANPRIVHVAGDYYAIAYIGIISSGVYKLNLTTIQITSDGQITPRDTYMTDIEPLPSGTIHDTLSMVYLTGDIFVIGYHSRTLGSQNLSTIKISTDGLIQKTIIDTLQYDTSLSKGPASIIPIHETGCAIFYQNATDIGMLKTVSIVGDGTIGDEVVDTQVVDSCHSTFYGGSPVDGIYLGSDAYAFVYSNSTENGTIATFIINPDGTIVDTPVDTMVFDQERSYRPLITHLNDKFYTIAYIKLSFAGFVFKTIEITNAGVINDFIFATCALTLYATNPARATNDLIRPKDIHSPFDCIFLYYYKASDFGTGMVATLHTNNQSSTPEIQGPKAGQINVAYTFSVTAGDPDSYFLFDWGDGVTSDWLGPYDSSVEVSDSHIWMSPGSYDVKVKAKNMYGVESDWSTPVTVAISDQSSQQNQMQITAVPTVLESTAFTVTITNVQSGAVIAGADVTFNDQTKQTDAGGQVSFTAPEVTTPKVYTITASKEGYQSASIQITILLQQEEEEPQGWIYGLVQEDPSSDILSDVSICAVLSSTGMTVKCTSTDVSGQYMISLPPGTYTVTATKPEYLSNTKQIVVEDLKAIEVTFHLEKKQQMPPPSQVTDTTITSSIEYVEYLIGKETSRGSVGARADVTKNTDPSITTYIDGLHIDPNITGESVRFTMSADDGTQGTIIVFRIGEGVLADLDNIQVIYDTEAINEESDVAAFFDVQHSSDPAWLRVLTTSGLYVFVRVHFSTHTITISSIVEAINLVFILTVYSIMSAIIFITFISPILVNSIRRGRYLRGQKK
ncbi:MAG: carboxypeptidase regulatory-like domain-containing protein [Euryarchaeota archaeon]|nr:carboxypeptidase regulatory-like domain-containing protein [Euryarchaeota archaeon]